MKLEDRHIRLCDWYGTQIERLCQVKPYDKAIYRVSLADARSARPTTSDELQQRATKMVHELHGWGEMMMDESRLRQEIEDILFIEED